MKSIKNAAIGLMPNAIPDIIVPSKYLFLKDMFGGLQKTSLM